MAVMYMAARTQTCFISGRNNPTIEQDANKITITKDAKEVTDHHGLVHPEVQLPGKTAQYLRPLVLASVLSLAEKMIASPQ